jgi:hypothetical protein
MSIILLKTIFLVHADVLTVKTKNCTIVSYEYLFQNQVVERFWISVPQSSMVVIHRRTL